MNIEIPIELIHIYMNEGLDLRPYQPTDYPMRYDTFYFDDLYIYEDF